MSLYQGYGDSEDNEGLPITAINGRTIESHTDSEPAAMPAYAASDAAEIVESGLNKLVNGIPELLRVLDLVTQLHPFIGIVLTTFHVIFELQMKRQDSDKKVGILLGEMGKMVSALLLLRNIEDRESVGPDGQTIEARMLALIQQTAEDMKACANTCDTYIKKKLLFKVIYGPVWEGTLKGFIDLFANRRKEFTLVISIHVGIGVDDAVRKLQEIDENTDTMSNLFSHVVSPDQQELTALVQNKGGQVAVMGNDNVLRELLEFQPTTSIELLRGAKNDGDVGSHVLVRDNLAIVKQELFESPVLSIKKNLEVFERKFQIQQKELEEETWWTVHHERDRVIDSVTSGPRDRLIDVDIYQIWMDMQWSEHVKTSHFVLALCDYFRRDLYREGGHVAGRTASAGMILVAEEDAWALEWININRLQAIVEAIDDDSSGFITVAEINQFTRSRPQGWSLPKWLAYWAIGWEMTATRYRDLIDHICGRMFAIRAYIHPANRNAVDKYLRIVWKRICTLTSSLIPTSPNDLLLERFQDYTEAEEQRLWEDLEMVKYDIDSMDTLLLVIGQGRIERRLFIFLWLLLRRDFEIFRLCQNTIIHKDELWHSAQMICWVFEVIERRYEDLEALFKLQNQDPGVLFKTFSSGVFNLWRDLSKFWSLDNLRTLEFAEVEYDDANEDQDIDISGSLIYRSIIDEMYPLRVEESLTENVTMVEEAVHMVLGRWNGVQISEDGAISPMSTFYFHASEVDDSETRTYEASSIGADGTDYNILGEYATEEDRTVVYSFTQHSVARSKTTYWTGSLEDEGETLSGKWGYEKDHQPYTFVFKRVPPEVLADRPHPKEFTANRVKALWKFALTAVRNQVRRRMFSWSYLEERRDVRREYLDLLLKEMDGRLTDADSTRFSTLNHRLTFDDVRCFYIIHDYRKRAIPAHFGARCDYCEDAIYGTRVTCIECGTQDTLDFCDKPACVGCTIRTRGDMSSPHLPTHDFVKIRDPILHYREIGKVLRNATAGLKRAKNLLEDVKDQKRHHEFMNNAEPEVECGGNGNGDDGDSEASAPKDQVITLTCLRCEAPVSQPCFYCIDCPADSEPFICWDCDKRLAGFDVYHGPSAHHLATHNLVRCIEAQEEERKSGENRAEPLNQVGPPEDKLEGIQGQIAGLKSQMDVFTSQMARIEKLLQSLPQAHAE
ncbi:hypothetical protein V8D89_013293 [Ganoderma adspersum]